VNTVPSKASPSDLNNPIENFSQCHVGIVAHLAELARLPALLQPAADARKIAAQTLKFFRDAVFEHHQEEERELFPAVLASAAAGAERQSVQLIVERLVREHREVESAWKQLEPRLKSIAKGQDGDLDAVAVAALVARYQAHATYEEENFLPLSQQILGRNGNHLAALGTSLHLRHAAPKLMERFGGYI